MLTQVILQSWHVCIWGTFQTYIGKADTGRMDGCNECLLTLFVVARKPRILP